MSTGASVLSESGRRRWFVIFAVIATLTLAAGQGAQASSEKEEGEEEAEEGGFALDSSPYLDLDPFMVPIFQSNTLRGQLSVRLSLEISQGVDKLEVWRQTAKLRAGYSRSLNHYASNQFDTRKRVNIKLLKRLLQQVTDRILGADMAEVVLGQAIVHKQRKRRKR